MGSPQFFQLKPLRKSSSVQRENINKTRSLPSATICNSAHVSGNSLKILLCCFSMNFLTLHRPCTGESPRCWPERWRGDRMREGGGVHQQSLCFGFKSPGVFNCYYCPISCLMRDYFAPPPYGALGCPHITVSIHSHQSRLVGLFLTALFQGEKKTHVRFRVVCQPFWLSESSLTATC